MLVFGAALTTKETVVCDTPARRATSSIEGGRGLSERGGTVMPPYITPLKGFSKTYY
jgi:hypothetical protein